MCPEPLALTPTGNGFPILTFVGAIAFTFYPGKVQWRQVKSPYYFHLAFLHSSTLVL